MSSSHLCALTADHHSYLEYTRPSYILQNNLNSWHRKVCCTIMTLILSHSCQLRIHDGNLPFHCIQRCSIGLKSAYCTAKLKVCIFF